MSEYANVVVDVWGDFAMFTRPESKVERATYPVPTPSACRGILNAIYSKPVEFYYEITQIDVMKPIRFMTLRRNEVKCKADAAKAMKNTNYCIDTSDVSVRTQRMCTYIRDVYYRIHAKLVVREDAPAGINVERLTAQFNRRVEYGKCFFQPALGTKECMCYFSKPDMSMIPIEDSQVIGIMLYDVFDIRNNIPLNTSPKNKSGKTQVSFFNAIMEHGIIHVPDFDSDELLVRRE